MKKSISISVICLLFVSWAKGQIMKNDWTEMCLKGKIKSIRENRYEAVEKSGMLQNGKQMDSIIYIFNVEGNIIKKSQGIKAPIICTDYTYNYTYDSIGNMIEANRYNPDGSLAYKDTYKYDGNGNMIEAGEYNSNGTLDYKCTYKYDGNGNKVQENWHKPDGSIMKTHIWKYEYDKNLNWVKKIEFHEGAKPAYSIEREIEYFK